LAKKKVPSLIVEFASDSGNLYYLSVLEYRRQNYLCIIDNISSEEIGAYVLDFAQQEKLDLKQLMSLITYWFYRGSGTYPLSFEFSRLGITPATNRIYKTFELAHVTRLIGHDFRYDFESPPKVRRRRVSLIPAGTEVRLKRSAEDRKALAALAGAIAPLELPAQESSSGMSTQPA
jgi:hypothetical protein